MINSVLMAILAQTFAIAEIADEEVPAAAAPQCNIHWVVLGIIALYGVFAMARAISNSRSMRDGEEG